jgi:hypothetical protein
MMSTGASMNMMGTTATITPIDAALVVDVEGCMRSLSTPGVQIMRGREACSFATFQSDSGVSAEWHTIPRFRNMIAYRITIAGVLPTQLAACAYLMSKVKFQ